MLLLHWMSARNIWMRWTTELFDVWIAFCREILCKRGGVIMQCLYVCLSITFMNSVKTNKQIFKIFSSSGSQAILVFRYQMACRYSYGNPPNGVVKCRWGRQKSRFWAYVWLHCVLSMLRPARCFQHAYRGTAWPRSHKLWHIAGSKGRSLLIAGDDDEMFMTRSLNAMPKTTEQHFIAHSDKSVAYITNNKRLLLKLTTDRHKASHGLFTTAELLVTLSYTGVTIR